jgi:hypothetical protein
MNAEKFIQKKRAGQSNKKKNTSNHHIPLIDATFLPLHLKKINFRLVSIKRITL